MILSTDAFSQVFPEHKYLIVECLRELGYKVGMTGDGVNDAPALKRADVGVAVSGATEAAQSAAAIVLTKVGLSTIITGIITARCIFVRIRNFLTYRIAATLQLLVFFFIAVFWYASSVDHVDACCETALFPPTQKHPHAHCVSMALAIETANSQPAASAAVANLPIFNNIVSFLGRV